MKTTLDAIRLLVASPAHYATRLARSRDDIRAAQSLRFEVFNLELKQGLQESFATGLDEDPFDHVCDHLVVEHLPSNEIVGTYRMQTGLNAAAHLGYYSEQEFEFGIFERSRRELLELGRACVNRHHRNLIVLGLLWKGIAIYAQQHHARYLIGCSSLSSQDPTEGAAAYADLCRRHLAPIEHRTRPQPVFACPLERLAADTPKIPKLLRTYLTLGAKICGPPAIDKEFRTIDFLTFLDLRALPVVVRNRLTS